MLVLVGVMALLAMGGQAVAQREMRRAPRPLVSHPRWRLVARNVDYLLASGRYVLLIKGYKNSSGTLIDDQTGTRISLSVPAGCNFDNSYPPGNSLGGTVPGPGGALGGSWVVAACTSPSAEAPRVYELYSIPARRWAPFTPNLTQMLGPYCRGDEQCEANYYATYFAVGDDWIQFELDCGYHCPPAGFAFQNIQTGQVDGQPPDWKPGGTQIPDLNSPALTQTVCRPLRVGDGFPSPAQSFPGTVLFGRFAIAASRGFTWHLERCGSRLHKPIGGGSLAANRRTVVWTTGSPRHPHRKIEGVFLPGLRPLVVQGPTRSLSDVAFSSRALYVWAPGSRRVWRTANPMLVGRPLP